MRNKQSGFAMIEIVILAVVVVGILGFIGWSYFNQPAKKTASATTNSTSTSPSKETTTAATVTPQSTYLDFKELGVKVTLNSSIDDAVYAMYHNPRNDGTKEVGISAQSLISAQTDSNGYCNASGGAIGTIVESPTPFLAPPDGTQTLQPDGKTIFKIGNNYYRYNRPQNDAACAVGPVTTDMVEAKISAFEQAVTTLQADN